MAVGRCWLNSWWRGGPTCLRLSPSPRRQMESEGACSSRKDASSVCSERSPGVSGEHGDRAPHPALRHHQGQPLTERGRPRGLFLQQPLCRLHMDACSNCSMKRAGAQTRRALSRSRRRLRILQTLSAHSSARPRVGGAKC